MAFQESSQGHSESCTLTGLLAEGTRRLTAAGLYSKDARLEARLLISFAADLSREDFHLRPDTVVPSPAAEKFEALLTRREKREPLAYILGDREFYGLPYRVTPAVLIPRPETEFLVEAVVQSWKHHPAPRLADIGTGSGIIAVSLAVQMRHATVAAADISQEALKVAQENARRHGVAERVLFAQGDLLDPIQANAPFEAIASNPPYISPNEIATLEIEVRDFEPRIALGTHPDPLHFYRRLAAEAPPLLVRGGTLAVEVGQGQANDIISLWQNAGLTGVSTVRDYAGIERVVIGLKP